MSRKRQDEEDDYLSDEIEEEERREVSKPKRKKRKPNLLDIEAEEDDAEDEEEDDEFNDIIVDDDPDADEDRRAAKVQQLQRKQALENDDPEEYARYIQQRFGDDFDDDDDTQAPPDTSGIDQQSLLPTIRDPRLYIVRIRKPGHERRAILTLLQKYFDLKTKGIDIGIMSAVAPDNLKGIVYVEASNATSVEFAIAGLDLFNSYQGVKALRLEEMTDVVKVVKRLDKLKSGDWVRPMRGLYKNDLAQVVRLIDGHENYCMVRLIPRLDIRGEREMMDEDEFDDDPDHHASGSLLNGRRRGRPPQKLFDKEEIYRLTKSADMHAERDTVTGEIFDVWNSNVYRHGLQYIRMPIKSLIQGENVQPQVEEVEKWIAAEKKLRLAHEANATSVTAHEARIGLNIQFSSTVGAPNKSGLFKGDKVHVTKGEQKGLTGSITGFDGNVVLIECPEFPEPLRVGRGDVVKTFEAGETVKIASGKYSGESGAIVSVEGEFLTIFTDSTRKEIRVLAAHVADSNDLNPTAAQQTPSQGRVHYELFDLVSLVDDNSKGVVVKVQNDGVQVVNTQNVPMVVPFNGIKAKLKDRSARAHDARGNPIAPNDSIHVISGPMKHRHGVVLHVSGPSVFFRARDEIRHCGVIACLASSVTASTAAARRLKSSLGGSKAPAPIPRGSIASLGVGGFDPRRGGGGRGGPPYSGQDPLLRQDIKVTKGEWKGYIGKVIYADSKIVRVQLASNMKTVKIAKNKVKLLDGANENAGTNGMNSGSMNGAQNNGFSGSRGSSLNGLRTPRPSYMQTPNPGSISRRFGGTTPAPNAFGSMTPRHPYGSATPGPNQTPRNPYSGFGMATPRSDAFRPTTPGRNADPYANPYDNQYPRGASTPIPMTPAADNPYASYSRQGVPQTPNMPGDGLGVSTPGPFHGGVVEPGTPAPNMVPNTPGFAGIVEPRTPAVVEPHTPAPMGAEPQTPAPGIEPATPAPGLEPATPAPGLEPATPMVEPTTPHTPAVPHTPMVEGVPDDAGSLGYKVLIDVVVSIASEDGASGVVRDAAADGSEVHVTMLSGPRNGQNVTMAGHNITPVQPRAEIDENDLETVKVLDGHHQGKIGELTKVQGDGENAEGVVRFQDGEVGMLALSLVAKCRVM